MTKLYRNQFDRTHVWVTVVNPINHRMLLQACDGCGVVKSENTIVRNCKAVKGTALISGSMESSARAC